MSFKCLSRSSPRLCMFIISITITVLASCGSSPRKAVITDAAAIPSQRLYTHTVSAGETLYAIALRYDLDYKILSKINKLSSNHQIHPGQVLSLKVDAVPTPVKAHSPVPSRPKAAPPVAVKRPLNQTKVLPPVSAKPIPIEGVKWQWPLNGKVLERFNPNAALNKGIDIQGKLGEPVVAAADGDVVYSGSGLRGYGKLLIVKHNQKYLSAYAHNHVLHVSEGDSVKAGQKIAEVGFEQSNTSKLHFEIRLDGKPVDPLFYLPKR